MENIEGGHCFWVGDGLTLMVEPLWTTFGIVDDKCNPGQQWRESPLYDAVYGDFIPFALKRHAAEWHDCLVQGRRELARQQAASQGIYYPRQKTPKRRWASRRQVR